MTTSIFACPVCKQPLARLPKQYVCPGNHSFDIAASGHVNLLLANRKHSPNPGDDKVMTRARADFLKKGYFTLLADELAKLANQLAHTNGSLLDSGCSEGYYTTHVANALRRAQKNPRVAGVDVAKHAIQLAAKKDPGSEFAVASAYELPVADNTIDFVWSCFAPTPLDEFHRILVPGGHAVIIQPSARHLWGVKSIIYDTPYENPPNTYEHPGLENKDRHEISARITVDGGDDLLNLFRMTPYAWKTSVQDGEKLKRVDSAETEIGFIIDTLVKK